MINAYYCDFGRGLYEYLYTLVLGSSFYKNLSYQEKLNKRDEIYLEMIAKGDENAR